MCGRFTNKNSQAIYEEYRITMEPNFNVAPSTSILTITDKPEMMLWAYNPTWAKDPFNLINARSETLREKPSFKMAKRCLIIADGWYEWSRNGSNKQPFYFHLSNNVFAFAGIYTSYQGVNGCAIITREANQNISDIHHRMPVILDKKDENLWLNGDDIFNSELSEQIEYYPVRKIVNSPRNNSTECIEQESI